jgi:APA family basic amino acid/polyamine antiporter
VAEKGKESPGEGGGLVELRRDVSIWGSFTWGFADVGADTFVALGLVMAVAHGATPLAFAAAGLIYITIGLAYTELASAYPVAGGGQYFTLRGIGDFWGFVAGSALLLDYTIDIALFCTASAGYVNFFFPAIRDFKMNLGPFHSINPIWGLQTLVLIFLLMLLNIRGIRESSLFNEVIGALDMVLEGAIIVLGLVFAWKPEMMVHQILNEAPTMKQFLYAVSVAIISYVGLESISQAAQETRRPATVIPRTSLTLIFVVLLFAMMFPVVSLGILPWQTIAAREGDPLAALASAIPYVGFLAGQAAAVLGATIVLISANTGVMGASRLTYSMSEFRIVGKWFNAVHPKYRTPVRSVVFFSMVAVIEALISFLAGPRAMDIMVNMYAFGATLAYLLSFISLITLRIKDPYTPRPYKMPFNVRWGSVEVPILGLLGVVGTTSMLALVVWTHSVGRIAGPGWVLLWLAYYLWYRKRQGLPIFGSIKRNWEQDQIAILTSAEEFDLLETYKLALAERDKEKQKEAKRAERQPV